MRFSGSISLEPPTFVEGPPELQEACLNIAGGNTEVDGRDQHVVARDAMLKACGLERMGVSPVRVERQVIDENGFPKHDNDLSNLSST